MPYNSRFASKEELALHLAATPDQTTLLVEKYTQAELVELPDNLTSLRIYHCPHLLALPKLPKSLSELRIHNCPSLAELPNFPSTMTSLLISKCSALRELPALTYGLKELRLELAGLADLPVLPDSLSFLHLSGCSGLVGRSIQVGKLRIKIG
jgi:hypothetical protein